MPGTRVNGMIDICSVADIHGPGGTERALHAAIGPIPPPRGAYGRLDWFPHSDQSQRAEELWRELRLRLASNELRIANFYMARKEYESAAARYQQILDDYPGLGLDAEALYKLGVCYLNTDEEEKARRAFHAILENYADSEMADR